MSVLRKDELTPDRSLLATCGLFCPACTLYIGTREDPKRLAAFAERFQVSEEEVKCYGCHSHKRSPYCTTCSFVACAAEKGIDFCGQCDDYPCDDLKAFQAERPHRIELWTDLERINEIGYPQWFSEKLEEFSCQVCGAINSAYDLTCRACGADPSCEYVRRHGDAVRRNFAARK